MDIRFYNARILTMEEERDIFWGEVWVRDDQIIYVGDGQEKDKIFREPSIGATKWEREIDCNGNLLMPGFKDAHTHSGMTLLRSFADDLPLDEWLNGRVFPVEAKMTAEDIYELSKLAILEYLSSGITAVFDMYLTPESIADAFDDMGMRCVQVGAVNNFSQSLELVEEMYQKLNRRSPLQSYILGFHAEYTSSKELLEGIAALSPEEGEGGGEIAVLTAYQAKGLEFDAAILYNVSAYGSSSRTDMHLLYVAMTRPLHRLDLLCDGDVCAPLRSLPVRTISG